MSQIFCLLVNQNTHIFSIRNSMLLIIYMKKQILKLIALSVVTLVVACGSTRQMTKPAKEERVYNQEALNHIIDGSIADLIGSPQEAIVNYQQAAEIDTSSPGIYYALAENYYMLDELKTSIRLCRRALRLDPANIEALELMAASYEKMQQYRDALSVYQDIVELQPNDLNSLYSLTSMQIVSREYDKAASTYKKMVQNGLTEPDFRLRIGHLFLQSRATEYAESVYLDIFKEFPDYEPVYLALAATQKTLKDTTKAIDWYLKGLTANPKFNDVKAELRVLYEKRKTWDEAIATFSMLVEKDPENLDNKLQLGQFQLASGDTISTQKTYELAIEQHPFSERAYLALGAIEKIAGDTTAAIAAYQTGLEKRQSFLDVRRRLRDIFTKRKQFDQAIALYEPLTDSDSTFVGAQIEIANLTLQKGDTLQAIEKCQALFETHGDDWRVPLTLGRYYFIAGESDKAIPLLIKAKDTRPDIPYLWVLTGINYLQLDSLDAARNNFETAVKKFPDDPEINYYLGSVHARKQEFNQAIPFFEKSNEKDPDNIQTLLALAGAYDENRQYSVSENIYKKLLEKNPGVPIVLNNYAYHLSVRGTRLEEALQMVQFALDADPDNAPYLDTIGWIYYQLGDYNNAITFTKKSLAIQEDSPEVLEHLGDIFDKMGDRTTAEEYWRKSLEIDKNRTHVLEKLGSNTP